MENLKDDEHNLYNAKSNSRTQTWEGFHYLRTQEHVFRDANGKGLQTRNTFSDKPVCVAGLQCLKGPRQTILMAPYS